MNLTEFEQMLLVMRQKAEMVPQRMYREAQAVVGAAHEGNVVTTLHQTSTGVVATVSPVVGANVDSAKLSRHAVSLSKKFDERSSEIAKGIVE